MDFPDDNSALLQIMAWCLRHQATIWANDDRYIKWYAHIFYQATMRLGYLGYESANNWVCCIRQGWSLDLLRLLLINTGATRQTQGEVFQENNMIPYYRHPGVFSLIGSKYEMPTLCYYGFYWDLLDRASYFPWPDGLGRVDFSKVSLSSSS